MTEVVATNETILVVGGGIIVHGVPQLALLLHDVEDLAHAGDGLDRVASALRGGGDVEQHELVLQRTEQYQMALADGNAFQKRFMTLPFSVPKHHFKAEDSVMEGDEGVTISTPEGLAKLKPVFRKDGIVTAGNAPGLNDGAASLVVASQAFAEAHGLEIQAFVKNYAVVGKEAPQDPKGPTDEESEKAEES